jgi:hypothetical protein
MNSGVVFVLAVLMAAGVSANAAGPTAADFAACNTAAAEKVAADTPSPSPQTERPDPAGRLPAPPASGPRNDIEMPPSPSGKAGAAGATRDPTGAAAPGAGDPRREGVAADRIDDPNYVAAYEACMREKGF